MADALLSGPRMSPRNGPKLFYVDECVVYGVFRLVGRSIVVKPSLVND